MRRWFVAFWIVFGLIVAGVTWWVYLRDGFETAFYFVRGLLLTVAIVLGALWLVKALLKGLGRLIAKPFKGAQRSDD